MSKRSFTASKEDDGESVVFELGKKKKLSVRKFKGMMLADIREFWSKNGSEELPGKKVRGVESAWLTKLQGISLTKDQWQSLVDIMPEVNRAMGCIEEGSVYKKAKKEELPEKRERKAAGSLKEGADDDDDDEPAEKQSSGKVEIEEGGKDHDYNAPEEDESEED